MRKCVDDGLYRRLYLTSSLAVFTGPAIFMLVICGYDWEREWESQFQHCGPVFAYSAAVGGLICLTSWRRDEKGSRSGRIRWLQDLISGISELTRSLIPDLQRIYPELGWDMMNMRVWDRLRRLEPINNLDKYIDDVEASERYPLIKTTTIGLYLCAVGTWTLNATTSDFLLREQVVSITFLCSPLPQYIVRYI